MAKIGSHDHDHCIQIAILPNNTSYISAFHSLLVLYNQKVFLRVACVNLSFTKLRGFFYKPSSTSWSWKFGLIVHQPSGAMT